MTKPDQIVYDELVENCMINPLRIAEAEYSEKLTSQDRYFIIGNREIVFRTVGTKALWKHA